MQNFLASTDVTIEIPLTDRSGTQLTVASIAYRVLDQDGNELVASAPLSAYNAGDATASVTVPGASNGITPPDDTAVRQIELTCTLDTSNTTQLLGIYGLYAGGDVLVEGLNSIQTLARAEMTALSMTNLPGWAAASEDDKIRALKEAKVRLYKLSYRPYIGIIGQDNEQYVPDGGVFTSMAVSGDPRYIAASLELITPAQFKNLPERFKTALRYAQIAEAESILFADPNEAMRMAGVTMDRVGDSEQQFRPVRPLTLMVGRRAMTYLAGFLVTTLRITRR